MLRTAGGYPTSLRLIVALLGESVLTCWFTLWGIKVYWLCSSAELTLVPWWIEQLDRLDNSLLPQFQWEKAPVGVLDKSSGRQVTRC